MYALEQQGLAAAGFLDATSTPGRAIRLLAHLVKSITAGPTPQLVRVSQRLNDDDARLHMRALAHLSNSDDLPASITSLGPAASDAFAPVLGMVQSLLSLVKSVQCLSPSNAILNAGSSEQLSLMSELHAVSSAFCHEFGSWNSIIPLENAEHPVSAAARIKAAKAALSVKAMSMARQHVDAHTNKVPASEGSSDDHDDAAPSTSRRAPALQHQPSTTTLQQLLELQRLAKSLNRSTSVADPLRGSMAQGNALEALAGDDSSAAGLLAACRTYHESPAAQAIRLVCSAPLPHPHPMLYSLCTCSSVLS